jgi:hypothetical protein
MSIVDRSHTHFVVAFACTITTYIGVTNMPKNEPREAMSVTKQAELKAAIKAAVSATIQKLGAHSIRSISAFSAPQASGTVRKSA